MNRSPLLNVLVGVAGTLGLATSFTVLGQGAAKPDPGKAQQIATQVCAACHGADGNSATAANPHLAGQVPEYTTRQLRHFKDGVRQNDVMQAMVASLSDEDMRALGSYFFRQPQKGGAARDAELVTLGQRLYRGGDPARNLPACAGCHAATGEGMPINYPRLAGQFAEYTFAQLKAFRDERRGNDKEGRDVNGRIMAEIAARMSDQDMRAVAEYAAGLM
jgi:cytochrome c553